MHNEIEAYPRSNDPYSGASSERPSCRVVTTMLSVDKLCAPNLLHIAIICACVQSVFKSMCNRSLSSKARVKVINALRETHDGEIVFIERI